MKLTTPIKFYTSREYRDSDDVFNLKFFAIRYDVYDSGHHLGEFCMNSVEIINWDVCHYFTITLLNRTFNWCWQHWKKTEERRIENRCWDKRISTYYED